MGEILINGQLIPFINGESLLQTAQKAGITIPTLCFHKDLTPYGGCQLCLVDVKGERRTVQACTYEVKEGLVVKTETPAVRNGRRAVLKLLLGTYFDAHPDEEVDQENELFKWARFYHVPIRKNLALTPRYLVDTDPNPFIHVDLNKCIMCTRCVRACAQIQGRFVWAVEDRGYNSRIVAGRDEPLLDARCESCGACVAYCPTGALSNKMSLHSGKADKLVTTTCTYCGVGCQVILHVKDNKITSVSAAPDAPVNEMRLCVKGRYGYDFVHHQDRLTQPMVRKYLLEKQERSPRQDRGEWVKVDWKTALEITAEKLAGALVKYGSNNIGILCSAKCTNEENYLMNKFARQVIGTNNIDHCARLCHSSSVAGLAASYGSGAMSNSMDDLANFANMVFITGSNTTEQHPVFGTMLRQAVLRRGLKIIVADPRKIDLTEFAVIHLQMKGGTDITLLNGLMHIILKNGWEDKGFIQKRSEGFDEFAANLDQYLPAFVSHVTGVPEKSLHKAAELLGTIKPGAFIWGMGISQHVSGVHTVQTIANFQMLLGNIGIPGGGVNPLRGQNNVQGASDMGGTPNVYPGYQSVLVDKNREKFENAWGAKLSPDLGMTVTEMVPGIQKGKIKALYILGENPILTDPDTNHARECFEELDFMVLQDIFPTETSAYADVLLPGVSFAEKSGTFTNTERRVQLVKQAISPSGQARQDWQTISDLANLVIDKKWRGINSAAPYAGWQYDDPENILREISALTPSYAGVTYSRLWKGERLQWPVESSESNGTPILFAGQFPRGKGLFTVTNQIPPAEKPDNEYPFLLNTGRILYHWHGGEMTRRAKGLMSVAPRSMIEINPEDAYTLGIMKNGDPVFVTSRRGKIKAYAWITDRVAAGSVFANFHFAESPTNALTIAALDPVSKIPEYKVCAVKVELVNP